MSANSAPCSKPSLFGSHEVRQTDPGKNSKSTREFDEILITSVPRPPRKKLPLSASNDLGFIAMQEITSVIGAPNFTFLNDHGSYGVGFRVVYQYDYSRAYKGPINEFTGKPTESERARPIQTLIWYPAEDSSGRLTYLDYLALVATEDEFDCAADNVICAATDALKDRSFAIGLKKAKQEAERTMWAIKEAKPIAGMFPVIVYAPSFSASAFENADLCEYLASQGYVVIASPAMGRRTRYMANDLEDVEAQVGDIGFLIGYARSLPHADTSRVAVIGYSWGGLSNVFAGAKDSRISALVCLDGSFRYYPELVKAAKFVTPVRLAVPLLYVSSRPPSIEQLNKDKIDVSASLMNEMKYSDIYKVTMHTMGHQGFSSEFLRFSPSTCFSEYSREEASLAYGWVARYVHQFLNAYLRRDADGLAFIKNDPKENSVPLHLLSIDVQPAEGPPPTIETLAAGLGCRGFEYVCDIYKEINDIDAGFQLSENEVIIWGKRLLTRGMVKEAIEILKFGVNLYSNSAKMLENIAEAYENNNDLALAVEFYKRLLELDPINEQVAQRLEALSGR